MSLLNKITPNCKEATMYAVQAQDEPISLAKKIKLGFHLLYCAPCRLFVRQLKAVSSSLNRYKALSEKQAQHRLSDEVKRTMQEKINNAGAAN